jgi:hypothetical protein
VILILHHLLYGEVLYFFENLNQCNFLMELSFQGPPPTHTLLSDFSADMVGDMASEGQGPKREAMNGISASSIIFLCHSTFPALMLKRTDREGVSRTCLASAAPRGLMIGVLVAV